MKPGAKLHVDLWGPEGWSEAVQPMLTRVLHALGWDVSIRWTDQDAGEWPSFQIHQRLKRRRHEVVVQAILVCMGAVARERGADHPWAHFSSV